MIKLLIQSPHNSNEGCRRSRNRERVLADLFEIYGTLQLKSYCTDNQIKSIRKWNKAGR